MPHPQKSTMQLSYLILLSNFKLFFFLIICKIATRDSDTLPWVEWTTVFRWHGLLSVIHYIRSSQSEGGESLSSRFHCSEVLQHAVMGCHSEQRCVCPLGTLRHGKVCTELSLYGAKHAVDFFFLPASSLEWVKPPVKALVVLSASSLPHNEGEAAGAENSFFWLHNLVSTGPCLCLCPAGFVNEGL